MIAPTERQAALWQAGVLADVDVHVAETLARLGEESDDDVLLAAALASRAPRHGHVCVELGEVRDRLLPVDGDADDDPELGIRWPDAGPWRGRLADSGLVRTPDGDATTPLVLEDARLYLDRYWRYQQRLASRLESMARQATSDPDPGGARAVLDRLFPGSGVDDVDRQRLAAALALLRRLVVLSGGPGTGKTTTVARVLALLAEVVEPPGRTGRLRIALAGPTGKAATRLQEAIHDAVPGLDVGAEVAEVLERVEAATLHRLLGWRSRNTTRFRHDAERPLPYDVIVVDEASMVSLPLMTKLVEAVPDGARLLLVGDRDQLASIEAGAVLADVCGGVRGGARSTLRLSEPVAHKVDELVRGPVRDEADVADDPGIWDSIVHLEEFHRFSADSGIGQFARGVQQGAPAGRLVDVITGGEDRGRELQLLDPTGSDPVAQLRDAVVDRWRAHVETVVAGATPEQALAGLDHHRVLCALRRGPEGVDAVNERIEQWLSEAVPGFDPRQRWYPGRPVMVTTNDYGVRLFNGDTGVVLADPGDPSRRVVAFPTASGEPRRLSPARLPACETTFATSIHKSQGSQFDAVHVVLPTVPSPILTRELCYTAITRARQQATVLSSESILHRALRQRVQRASGLRERLWPGAAPTNG